jgi:hypothetical protein
MASLLGTSGILLILAGICLLWQARRGFLYWTEAYLRIFRNLLVQPGSKPALVHREKMRAQELKTLELVVGVVLAFLLGPALLAVGLILQQLAGKSPGITF